MDPNEPVHRGYLQFPLHGNVLNKITKKKIGQPKFCMLFNASKGGIERLEIYENKDDITPSACQRIITLENCIKITHTTPNTITIVTKVLTQQLSTLTEDESQHWVTALQAVAFKNDTSKQISIDEDNDLYCSSGEGIFSVKLCPSEASLRCNLEPVEYTLLITTTGIMLKDINDSNKCYASWPFKYIRRYGYRINKFSFEGGRKCLTGEGTFHFEHSNQQEIFRCVSSKIKSMKQKMTGESLSRLDLTDQLASLRHREAGSRSPLPSFVESITASKGMFESSSKHVKVIPDKPPRRNHIYNVAKDKHENDFLKGKIDLGPFKNSNNPEPVNKKNDIVTYDEVKVESEAWKARGINEVDHIEFPPLPTSNNNNFMRLISRSQDNLDSCGSGESKITLLTTPEVDPRDASYDRLDHLRSSRSRSKISEYDTVLTSSTMLNPNNNSKETWQDYDEVENVMQSVRLADDSYMGYGMLRKPSIPGPQVPIKSKNTIIINSDESANHQNVSQYAQVSKPRRV